MRYNYATKLEVQTGEWIKPRNSVFYDLRHSPKKNIKQLVDMRGVCEVERIGNVSLGMPEVNRLQGSPRLGGKFNLKWAPMHKIGCVDWSGCG